MVSYMDQRSSLLPLELLPGVGSHSLLVHLLHLIWELSFDDEATFLLRPSVSMNDLVTTWRYNTTARLVSQSCTKGLILVELAGDGVWRSLQLWIIFVELRIITDTINGTRYWIRNILNHPGVYLGPVNKRNWGPQNSFWSASS